MCNLEKGNIWNIDWGKMDENWRYCCRRKKEKPLCLDFRCHFKLAPGATWPSGHVNLHFCTTCGLDFVRTSGALVKMTTIIHNMALRCRQIHSSLTNHYEKQSKTERVVPRTLIN